MSAGGRRGGEPDGMRLLALAHRELLEEVLPQLDGDARYRARLIANAMKIAAQELDTGAAVAEERARLLGAFARSAPGAPGDGGGEAGACAAIGDAMRAGRLDGDPALYRLLGALTRQRRGLLG